AFGETIAGICNLAGAGAVVELRVVIQKMNYMRLGAIADFIIRNLSFVAWTAFMGLEYVGRVAVNEKDVWVEPLDYVVNLADAVTTMAQMGHDVAIYNIPLCLLPDSIHQYACKSISDWKNKYLSECDACRLRTACCGLFATSSRTFQGITSQI
ncbi:MAG: His-Xaa-Ser system radical SAM maturase HxsC, partial [Muribaculaceae bacterium]|nr:His-Xaa-Ser system radical SAM maturase HxsC [Muribaculaceae bacterium]